MLSTLITRELFYKVSSLKVFVRLNNIYEFKKVLEFCLGATEHKMKQKVTEVTDNIYSGLLTANTSVEHK